MSQPNCSGLRSICWADCKDSRAEPVPKMTFSKEHIRRICSKKILLKIRSVRILDTIICSGTLL